jgi:hypothetical protein
MPLKCQLNKTLCRITVSSKDSACAQYHLLRKIKYIMDMFGYFLKWGTKLKLWYFQRLNTFKPIMFVYVFCWKWKLFYWFVDSHNYCTGSNEPNFVINIIKIIWIHVLLCINILCLVDTWCTRLTPNYTSLFSNLTHSYG